MCVCVFPPPHRSGFHVFLVSRGQTTHEFSTSAKSGRARQGRLAVVEREEKMMDDGGDAEAVSESGGDGEGL